MGYYILPLPSSHLFKHIMDHYKLVLPEHLNHYGFLFGGYLLHWIDEVAYITTTINFPGREFVTVAMDNVVFKESINKGEVLKFQVLEKKRGRTSVHYQVQVFGQTQNKSTEQVLFETTISFVCVDEQGNKKAIG